MVRRSKRECSRIATKRIHAMFEKKKVNKKSKRRNNGKKPKGGKRKSKQSKKRKGLQLSDEGRQVLSQLQKFIDDSRKSNNSS